MIKKIYICLAWGVLFICTHANAQLAPIYYVFNEPVVLEIERCLQKTTFSPTEHPYLQWFKLGDTAAVMITKYDERDTILNTLIVNSNRYIRIKQQHVLPILLSNDILYSEDLNVVLNKGTPREAILTKRITKSGWVIYFTGRLGKMKLIGSKYFQY